MRDRLERLQTIREEYENNSDILEEESDDTVTWTPEAATFNAPSAIDTFLKKVHDLSRDVVLFRMRVTRLCATNERLATTVRCFPLLKEDSKEIAREIQQHADELMDKLLALGEQTIHTEQTQGSSSVVSRIMRAQHNSLTHMFSAAMVAYYDAEDKQRLVCRKRVIRQAAILGSNLSDERLDWIVERRARGWSDLSYFVEVTSGKSYSWAHCGLKERHMDLLELEDRMKGIHSLFLQMALLVEEQGCMINNIEANVCRTEEYTLMTHMRFKAALQYRRQNPLQRCFPCFPCW